MTETIAFPEIQPGFSPIEEAVQDIAAGKFVIVVDDEDRENEGDLCIAAEKITPEAINFMATYGRGLICLAEVRVNLWDGRQHDQEFGPHARREERRGQVLVDHSLDPLVGACAPDTDRNTATTARDSPR